ncbi:peptidase S24 [Opitutaceae bacterium TAV5]|nr:peptidase S24 [Opitutaceae bacterium TAV5]
MLSVSSKNPRPYFCNRSALFRRLPETLAVSLVAICGYAQQTVPVQVPRAEGAFQKGVSMPIAPHSPASPVNVPPPADSGSPATPAGESEVRLLVKGVRFTGNTLFTDEELRALVAADLGKELSFGQLQALAARVETWYHSRGYVLTRVLIPKQEIGEQRILEFRVLEGWVGEIAVDGTRRFSADRVRRTLLDKVTPGEPFKLADMERAMLLLNRNSGITASSTLKPGREVGSTDLDINVKEDRRITGSIEIDNFGSEDTGEYRVIPSVTLPNFTGHGDALSIFGVFSLDGDNLYFGQAAYETPLGVSGTKFSSYFSMGNYGVGNEFSALEIEGDNLSWGTGLSQDFILSTRTSINIEGWFEYRDSEQDMLGSTSSKDHIRKLRAGINLDHRDLYGRTFVSLHIHQGLGDILGAMDNDDPLSSRSFAGADNRFTKLTASVTRLQSLHPRLYLLGSLFAQYGFDSLVAGEQLAIGGADSVRGHPQSVYAGDDGFVVNLEARFSVLPNSSRYQLAAFIDHGEVHTKKPVIGQDEWTRLSGTGAGVRVNLLEHLDVRVDVGVPLGPRSGDSVYCYAQAIYTF